MRLKNIYFNHQLRKAEYFKLRTDHPDGVGFLKENYYEAMISEDRHNILKNLMDITGKSFEEVNDDNFDLIIPFVMKEKLKELPLRVPTGKDQMVMHKLKGDVSYNISYIPEFKDVAAVEFFEPFTKNHN